MPVAHLLARQLGGINVRNHNVPKALPAPEVVQSISIVAAPIVQDVVVTPTIAVTAPEVPRNLIKAAQSVKSIAISEKEKNKVLSFTLADGTVDSVVVESTADLELKVADLASKIAELQEQAASVAVRLENIEKVI
jgi:hypothetical protein